MVNAHTMMYVKWSHPNSQLCLLVAFSLPTSGPRWPSQPNQSNELCANSLSIVPLLAPVLHSRHYVPSNVSTQPTPKVGDTPYHGLKVEWHLTQYHYTTNRNYDKNIITQHKRRNLPTQNTNNGRAWCTKDDAWLTVSKRTRIGL